MPQIADWDEDGDLDLLVGDRDGYIWLYLNSGTATNPVLNFAGRITANSRAIDVGENSCLVVADWNDDGKKELIIGDNNGYVYYHENIGTDASPNFASNGGVCLKTQGGSDIKVFYGAQVDAADWNAVQKLKFV